MNEKVGTIYSVFEDKQVIEVIQKVWEELAKSNSTDFYSQIFENEEVEKIIKKTYDRIKK